MTTKTNLRTEPAKMLAKFLGCKPNEIEYDKHDFNSYSYGRQEYLVVLDSVADILAKDAILDSLWAFNASFIVDHTREPIDMKAYDVTCKALQKMQGELCEDANTIVRALIDDLDEFVDDAIQADGRGHFLAGYDFEENEEGKYFIYRTN